MKIDKNTTPYTYYDMNGKQIHAGDIILMEGREHKVYLTDNDTLGIDATNPKWIEKGKAFPCEYGIYSFNREDEPILLK